MRGELVQTALCCCFVVVLMLLLAQCWAVQLCFLCWDRQSVECWELRTDVAVHAGGAIICNAEWWAILVLTGYLVSIVGMHFVCSIAPD